MKKTILLNFFILIISSAFSQRQIIFLSPTNYEGVLNDVSNSARAEALGKNTITLNGLRTSFENPSTIGPVEDRIQVALNYTKGHPYFSKSYYPFAGVSYRITNNLNIGFTTHQWIDPDSYWNAQIANQDFATDKKAQRVYSLIVSGQIAKNLFVGLSGNMLREMEIKGIVTAKDFILTTGIIYDKTLHFIKLKGAKDEKIRLAASLFNTLMDGQTVQKANETVYQYRDMPAILRIGVAHSFSLPFETTLFKNNKQLKQTPQTIELSTRLQYNNYLKASKNYTTEYKYQTMMGIGIEATALNFLSARIGYFTETRPPAKNNTDLFATKAKRKGFTWGLGCIIPADKWSNSKLPFELRFDVLAKNLPDLLDENISQRLSEDLTDKRLMLSFGLEFALKK